MILSANLQELMMQLFKDGHISYKTQKIYISKERYSKAISFLKRNDMIIHVCCVCQEDFQKNEKNICPKKDREHKNCFKPFAVYAPKFKLRNIVVLLNNIK